MGDFLQVMLKFLELAAISDVEPLQLITALACVILTGSTLLLCCLIKYGSKIIITLINSKRDGAKQ